MKLFRIRCPGCGKEKAELDIFHILTCANKQAEVGCVDVKRWLTLVLQVAGTLLMLLLGVAVFYL